MDRKEENLDAAEFVIGTLSGAEHAAFEILSNSNEDARKDVAFWERIFGSLNASVSPVIPSAEVWTKIDAQLGAKKSEPEKVASESSPVQRGSSNSIPEETRVRTRAAIIANDNHIAMTKSRSRWRLGAIAASIAALIFGFSSFGDNFVDKPTEVALAGEEYIAVVNANADQPALIVKVNGKTGDVVVRSLGMNRPDGKSLELWYVPEGNTLLTTWITPFDWFTSAWVTRATPPDSSKR